MQPNTSQSKLLAMKRIASFFYQIKSTNSLLYRLFVQVFFLLMVSGILQYWATNQKYYETEKILIFVLCLTVFLLIGAFWRAANILSQAKELHAQNEARLVKNNALLNAVSNFGADPIFVKDCEGRMIFANLAVLKVIDKERAFVLGRKGTELFSDAKNSMLIDTNDHLIISSGRSHIFEEVVHSATGSQIFQVTKSPWINESGDVGGIVGFAVDITEQKRNEDAAKVRDLQLEEIVAQRTKELRDLIMHLESNKEEEKRLLARELHDDLGSALTALNMHLAIMFKKLILDHTYTERIAKIQAILTSVTNTVRRIQSRLRPDTLDIFGLKVALSNLAEDFQSMSGIFCNASLPDEEIAYDPSLEITLYRMTQELLNNVAKHAKASTAELILDDNDEHIMLTIRDNGIGMDAQTENRNTHGLKVIREKTNYLGGNIDIISNEMQGTKITISIPKVIAANQKQDLNKQENEK